jgi:hypothetical protein
MRATAFTAALLLSIATWTACEDNRSIVAPSVNKIQATAVTTTTPLAGAISNPCTGELVNYDGDLHTTVTTTTNDNGETNSSLHTKFHDVNATSTVVDPVTGVTTINYIVHATNNEIATGLPAPPFQTHQEMSYHLQRHKEDPTKDDFLFHLVVHIKVAPGGVVTPTVVNVWAKCV